MKKIEYYFLGCSLAIVGFWGIVYFIVKNLPGADVAASNDAVAELESVVYLLMMLTVGVLCVFGILLSKGQRDGTRRGQSKKS